MLAVDQYDNILLFNERVKVLLQNSGLKIGEKLDGSIVLSQLAGYLREALETDSVFVRKLSCPTRSDYDCVRRALKTRRMQRMAACWCFPM